MLTTWFYNSSTTQIAKALRLAFLAVVIMSASGAFAGAPDWLREAAKTQVTAHGDEIAVVLLDERITNISSSGEIHTIYRRAYKILRPQGRRLGMVIVPFDTDNQLTYLKGWSFMAESGDLETVKEKDAIETSLSDDTLYSDTRHKLLEIPGAVPGNVIGYEYQQKEHSSVLQALWPFQDEIPVKRARFELTLPANWSYAAYWLNHADVPPQPLGQNRWVWELTDVPAFESEPEMPAWRSLAGHLAVSLVPPGASGKNSGDWNSIGRWYSGLSAGRRDVNAPIAAKARELTANQTDLREKIRALASFVQHQVRYVAIEIGVGGYQPHAAGEILANSYGDCKDKATLMSALLRSIGVDSYYVLINSERGYLVPRFPTMLSFDHVILAIRLPKDFDHGGLFSVQDESIGTVLYFDPTDNFTPLGYLPPSLQANDGLLVTDNGGELVRLPLLPPSCNRVLRIATLKIDESGNLEGHVQQLSGGPKASELREQLLAVPKADRQKVIERLITGLLDDATFLVSAGVTDLNSRDGFVEVDYSFKSFGYAQRVGQLFVFHPSALGHKSRTLLEKEPRKLPVSIPYATSESDVIDISLPMGFQIDEVPQSVKYEYPFATYKSELHAENNMLHYTRTMEFKDVDVPIERVEDLKAFFRRVSDDERGYAILKRTSGMQTANNP